MNPFRRTSTPTTAAAPRPARHWTPEGVTVAQRYRTLGGAIVLVYTPDADSAPTGLRYYAAACLGCTYRAASARPSLRPLDEPGAADLANAHAAACRAMQGPLPQRPGDDQADRIIERRLYALAANRGARSATVTLADLLADRVDLQRTDTWITTRLRTLAVTAPGLLHATAAPGIGTCLTIPEHPAHT